MIRWGNIFAFIFVVANIYQLLLKYSLQKVEIYVSNTARMRHYYQSHSILVTVNHRTASKRLISSRGNWVKGRSLRTHAGKCTVSTHCSCRNVRAHVFFSFIRLNEDTNSAHRERRVQENPIDCKLVHDAKKNFFAEITFQIEIRACLRVNTKV